MTPKQLLKKYKTNAAIARAFNYSRATVGIWVEKNAIPYKTQLTIQAITNGEYSAVKATNAKG